MSDRTQDEGACLIHKTEFAVREELPCPWCVIGELKFNRDKALAAVQAEQLLRVNFGKRLTAAEAQRDQLRAALVSAVESIQIWHNMGLPRDQRSEMWDIYWQRAPEMKPIREALKESA